MKRGVPGFLQRGAAKKVIFGLGVVAITTVCTFAATDVLLLIDSSSSMGGLSAFQEAFNGILVAVDANVPCSEYVRFAVADYRNYDDGGNYQTYGVNLVQPFTSLLAAVSAMNGLTADGGGDGPESQLKAMVTIAENWTTTAGDIGFGGRANAQRIIIWGGDAHGHTADDLPAGYYPTLDETIDALTAQRIMVFALNSLDNDHGLNEPYGDPARQQAGEITEATGGVLFNDVGSGSTEIEDAIVAAITCFEKYDDVDEEACRSPEDTITYTLWWNNFGGTALKDAYIIDYLPPQVSYPDGSWQFGYDPNAEPPIVLYQPDPGYDAEQHVIVYPLGDIDPNTSGFIEIEVVVNEGAAPGMLLHNVAELRHLVYDANGLNPVDTLAGVASEDTLVCCWETEGIMYVDAQADGSNTGMDWHNAYVDLQDALARARTCPQDYMVYIAEGEYSPGSTEPNSFELVENMQLYGGFPTGGCDFAARNPERYKTILTGRIDATHRNDTVVVMAHNTLLSGLTITEAGIYGVYGNGVDFTLATCTIEDSWEYGLRAINGYVNLKWCRLIANEYDGILHEGEGFTLDVANSWCRQNGRYGIRCIGSTPTLRNSIVSESDMSEAGNEGILMVNPTTSPVLQNLTIAHNKALGLGLVGTNLPVLDNLVVYHNNAGAGDQFSGFGRELFYYSCVYDPNDPNGVDLTPNEQFTISADPQLAFFDPNNVRISPVSPCRDAGNPALNYEHQLDMDGRVRVIEATADIGAYEVNLFDLDADGRVNLYEFGILASVWMAHNPADPQSASVPPENLALWDSDAERCNFCVNGQSQYVIDVADLAAFVQGAPWPLEGPRLYGGGDMMMFGGGDMQLSGFEVLALEAHAVPAKSTLEQQVGDLVYVVGELERLWLTDPGIQQEIDTTDWLLFMEALYGELIEACMNSR